MESTASFSYGETNIISTFYARLIFVNQEETERENVLAFAGSLLFFELLGLCASFFCVLSQLSKECKELIHGKNVDKLLRYYFQKGFSYKNILLFFRSQYHRIYVIIQQIVTITNAYSIVVHHYTCITGNNSF